MDPAPPPGCSLKDVKWSPVAVPLDLLVSTYRLPQIARLDSGVEGTPDQESCFLSLVCTSEDPVGVIHAHWMESYLKAFCWRFLGLFLLISKVFTSFAWGCTDTHAQFFTF